MFLFILFHKFLSIQVVPRTTLMELTDQLCSEVHTLGTFGIYGCCDLKNVGGPRLGSAQFRHCLAGTCLAVYFFLWVIDFREMIKNPWRFPWSLYTFHSRLMQFPEQNSSTVMVIRSCLHISRTWNLFLSLYLITYILQPTQTRMVRLIGVNNWCLAQSI